MNTQQAYNQWSTQYDTNDNKTRDLEGQALKTTLGDLTFKRGLEIGCGTGKNTVWLQSRVKHLTAIDFSDKMLEKARQKITSGHVQFIQADIKEDWNFVTQPVDLVTFSLVLEHIENLDVIFQKTAKILLPGGYVYIGELHPFKQYNGSKARFETENGTQVLTCFDHHISDFTTPAFKYGFEILALNEFFDKDDKTTLPRILTLLLRKENHTTSN